LRTRFFEQALQLGSLFASACDDDALAEERTRFEPVDGVVQLHDIADDDQRRRLQTRGGDARFNIGECARDRALIGTRRFRNHGAAALG
jgi:hypothetical protein